MAGGNKKYSVVEAGNLGFGQVGSFFLDASGAASPPTGLMFIAITFLEDSIFDASGGLVSEDENQYANTQAAAHNESDGSEPVTITTYLSGDVNMDGVVNVADIVSTIQFILEYSDFTIFSFQAIKHISSGDGGLLCLKNKKLKKKAF